MKGANVTDRVQKRIQRLRRHLRKRHIDTFVVQIAENRRYLSGYTAEDTLFDESAGVLFITDRDLLLATDSRYELQADKEAPAYTVFCYQKGLIEALPEIVSHLKSERMAFESERMSCDQYQQWVDKLKPSQPDIELIATKGIVEKQRLIKDESEIQALKKALTLSESVFEELLPSLHEGMTEKEAAWELEKGMREAGADALSFPVISASGPNSALPHAVPEDRLFKRNEPILFDWGARLHGYCADISRTIILGRPDETFKKVFHTVKTAQQKACEAIKPGARTKQVDKIARDFIDQAGFKGKFGHGLGHGTGLAIHENPRLSPVKDTVLQPGMVVTVEPGIYLPNWGGVRLENMAVVREGDVEILNGLNIELP
jgi:Xaa-Pro aminopeptidase